MFRLSLFGGFQLQDESGNPLQIRNRKAQLLLAFLALHAGQDHNREKLIDLFWLDFELDKADNNLRQAIYTIRQAIEPKGTPRGTYLNARQGVVRFSADSPYWLDAHAFEAKLKESENLAGDEKARLLKEAVALYRGHLLEGTYEDWILEAQEAFRTQYLQAVKQLVAHYTHERAYETALSYAKDSLNKNPLQEETHRQLMYLHHAMGERATALQQYEECKRMLAEELDLEPSTETETLREEIESRSASHRMGDLVAQARKMIRRYPELGAPFVGREAEFKALALAWAQVTEGRGKATAFAGEPGVGKSRLTQEFLNYVADKGGIVFSGRSYEIEGKLPYQPLIDGLRRGLDQLTPDNLAEVSSLWLGEVARLVPELAEQRADATSSASLHAPEQERNRLFESLTQFFRGLAQKRPVVLFVDDLQWADTSTLQFLPYLIRHATEDRLLVLGTYRDDELDEEHPFWKPLQQLLRDGMLERHNLAPLTAEELTEMINGMLKTNALDTLTRRVYDKSRGVPFYAEELVKTFMDAGAVALDDHRQWTLEKSKLTEAFVPPTVQALVETRLQRLPASALDLLEHVAVLGHGLRSVWLAKALDESEASLSDRLEELRQARYLEVCEGRINFRHDLARETVYRRLQPARKRRLHRNAAAALEPLYRHSEADQGQLLGALAMHFYEAAQWEQALDYNLNAGDHVWRTSYAKEEALHFLGQALKVAERLADERALMRAHGSLGKILTVTDQHDEGITHCLKALEYCTSAGERTDLFASVISACRFKRQYERALRYCEDGLAELDEAEHPREAAQLHDRAGVILMELHQPEHAITRLQHSLSLLEDVDDVAMLVSANVNLSNAYTQKGKLNSALEYGERGFSIAEAEQDLPLLVNAYFAMGYAHSAAQNLETAIQWWEKTIALHIKLADYSSAGWVFGHLAQACMRQGDVEKALAFAERRKDAWSRVGESHEISLSYGLCGCLRQTMGDAEQAKDCFEKALAHAREPGLLHYSIALSFAQLNQAEEAIRWFKQGRSHMASRLLKLATTEPRFASLREDPRFQRMIDA